MTMDITIAIANQKGGTGKTIKHHRQIERLGDQHERLSPYRLETKIRRNMQLSSASSTGKPIQLFDPNCHGAKDYAQLTEEVLKRCRQPVQV